MLCQPHRLTKGVSPRCAAPPSPAIRRSTRSTPYSAVAALSDGPMKPAAERVMQQTGGFRMQCKECEAAARRRQTLSADGCGGPRAVCPGEAGHQQTLRTPTRSCCRRRQARDPHNALPGVPAGDARISQIRAVLCQRIRGWGAEGAEGPVLCGMRSACGKRWGSHAAAGICSSSPMALYVNGTLRDFKQQRESTACSFSKAISDRRPAKSQHCCTARSMQHAPGSMQHATRMMHDAACNTHQAACNMQHA